MIDEELKTLKDIIRNFNVVGEDIGEVPIPEEIKKQIKQVVNNAVIIQSIILKKEAIKWIKKLDEVCKNQEDLTTTWFCLDCDEHCTENIGNSYMVRNKCKEHNVLDMDYSNNEIKPFIKHFFNIKEDDLK